MPPVRSSKIETGQVFERLSQHGLLRELRELNYELGEELGRGLTGTVYRALHIPTQIEVALKRLREFDPNNLYELKREFRALCEIEHPNLAHMHELVVQGEHRFFTMELIDGPHLMEWVRKDTPEGQWNPEISTRLCEALGQLAGVLETMHGNGWVHRDIKPSNARVCADGRVVLLDFALMTIIRGDNHSEKVVAGTVPYMAPEAIWTTEATTAADIYSLGVLAYECLTGCRPFVAKDLIQLDRIKRGGLPPFPTQSDDWLEQLLRQMTDSVPTKRPTAAAVSLVLIERSGADIPSASVHPPVFGREVEIAALLQATRQTHRLNPTVVRIQGSSGIGKTHLIREVLDQIASRDDAAILQGRCLPIATLPLPGIDGVADALSQELCRLSANLVSQCIPQKAAELVQLFPIFARVKELSVLASVGSVAVDVRERRRHGFAALRSLLARLSKIRKIVIWIDDFQWCDRDSAEFWRTMLREPASLLFITTARESQPCYELVEMGSVDTQDIHLEALPIPEIERMLNFVIGHEDHDVVSAIARESEGNPFLALQIAQHQQNRSFNRQTDHSMTLAGVLGERLANMSQDACRLLEACCLATRPLGLATIAKATNVRSPASAVQELLRAGRLVEHVALGPSMPLVPYHDRIREALVSGLGKKARTDLHLALAETLTSDSDADPVATFWHWRGAANDRMASEYAVHAGNRLMAAMAFDQAIQIYSLGLDAQDGSGDRSQIYERLGSAYEASGQGQLAGDAYERSADQAQSVGQNFYRSRQLQRRSAEALLRSGFVDKGGDKLALLLPVPELRLPYTTTRLFAFCAKQKMVAAVRWLIRLKPRAITPEQRERLDVLWTATVGTVWADLARSTYYQAFHTRFAFGTDDETHRTRAMATESCYLAAMGPKLFRPMVEWRIRQSLRAANDTNDPHLIALALTTSASTNFLVGEWGKSVELCHEAIELIEHRCTHAGWELSTAYILASLGLGIQGKLAEIEALRGKAIEEARIRDDRLASTWVRVGFANLTFLAEGRPEIARTTAREALADWPSSIDFSLLEFWALYGTIQADLYEGKASHARQRFEQALSRIRDSLILFNRTIRGAFRYLDGCTALAASTQTTSAKRRIELLRACAKATRRLKRDSLKWPRAMGWALYAGYCLEKRKPDDALNALQRAESSFERADMPLFKTAALYHQTKFTDIDQDAFGHEIQDPNAFAQCLLPFAYSEAFAPQP